MSEELVFGPVPSRRLGQSLGVNNIPPKICTYSCVYCQLGNTLTMSVERRAFFRPSALVKAVLKHAERIIERGGRIDYVTFVPDGEPTLDVNLGEEISKIKEAGFRVAVITNSSLMWLDDVREALSVADWVSVKVDAVKEDVWRRVNRPHKSLRLEEVLSGIQEFSKEYRGFLATETMLVSGINDSLSSVKDVAEFLSRLSPKKVYISVPTRPPAEAWVKPPDEGVINAAYQTFLRAGLSPELLTGFEGTEFQTTGDVREDFLAITSVHPMREDAVDEFLRKAGAGWDVVESLLASGEIVIKVFEGRKYFLRRLRKYREGSKT